MTDTRSEAGPELTAKDREEILKAEIALGLRKPEKLKPPVGNGGGIPLPEKPKANDGESLVQLTKRLQAEREKELHEQRLAFHDRQYTVHLNIAMEHAAKYDELSEASSAGSGGGG